MRIYPLHQRRASASVDTPAQTGDGATSLVHYRIRLDDGSEVVVPTSEALTTEILGGRIHPDTVIFDAGRGVWCRAAESALVRFIVEISIERPELHGWVAEADTPKTVPVPTDSSEADFLAALQAAYPEVDQQAPAPAPAVGKAPEPAPAPAAAKPSEPAPTVVKATESQPIAAKAPELPPVAKAPEPTSVKATAPEPAPVAKAPDTSAAVAKAPASAKPLTTDADAVAAVLGRIAPLGQQPAAKQPVTQQPAAQQPRTPPLPRAEPQAAKPGPVAKPEPVVAKAEPKPDPIFANPGPVVAKTEPVIAKPQPTAAKPQSVVAKAQPVVGKPQPVVAKPQSAVAKPQPSATASAWQTPDPSASPIPDWELGPEVETGDASLQLVSAGAGVSAQRGGKRRAGFVAASLAASVAAMVTIGVVLQGREASADDIVQPLISMTPPAVPVAIGETPETELSTIRSQAGENDVAPEPVTPEPAAPAEPAKPTLKLSIPTLSGIGEGLVSSNLDVRPNSAGGLVALPTPPRPTGAGAESSRPLQLPQLRNASRVQQALDREYPIGLKEVGQGGRVEMSFYINDRGVVERYEIKQSSGIAALDQAALRVAPVFEFVPAQRGNQRVAVWYSSGITFGRVTSATMAGTASSDRTPPAAEAPNQPTATQFDVAPQVRNAAQVRQELDRQYPIGLRATGKGGRVEVWFYVNERGRVEQSRLKRTSGDADLDQAALRVAQVFEFIPGLAANAPAAGWISLAIVFDALSNGP